MSSRSVDERIVEMKFNNAQFERNCQQSINTIDTLNSKVDKMASNKKDVFGFMTKSADNVDLSGISRAMDAVQRKFSVFGTVTDQIIRNMTTNVMGGVKNTINKTIGQITQGGLQRAMNIKQAQFQLEGLDVAWEKISDDINYGVADTAYGLDAAAIAASQLVASGVEFGETFGETGNSPMAKALRGISGVAAMTNSSYEDISRIFTTVAGNGKVMANELNQLGSRGLNAAANMAKFFNSVNDGSVTASEGVTAAIKQMTGGAQITEAELREFASQSKINFAVFSEAMDSAFGDHAKEANKTFNGALANVQAALKKIGAEFYLPALDEARDILNALREQINQVKNAVTGPGSLVESLVKLTKHISIIVQSFINSGAMTESIIKAANRAKEFVDKIDDSIDTLGRRFKNLKDMFGPALSTITNIFGRTSAYFGHLLPSFADGFEYTFKRIRNAFVKYDISKDLESVANLMESSWKRITSGNNWSDMIARMKDLGSTLGSIFASVGRTFSYIGGIVSHFATSVYKAFTLAFGHFGDFMSDTIMSDGLLNVLKTFETFVNGIENFFAKIEGDSEAWNQFTISLMLFFEKFKSITDLIGTAIGVICSAIGSLVEGISLILSPSEEFADRLKAINDAASPLEKGLGVMSAFFDTLKEKIASALPGVSEVAKAIGEGLGGAIKFLEDRFGKFNIDSLFGALTAGSIANSIQSIANIIWRLRKTFAHPLAIKDNLTDIKMAITDFFGALERSVNTSVIVQQAAAITLMAVSLKVLEGIKPESLIASTTAILVMMAGLSKMSGYMSTINSFKGKGLGTNVIALGVAILVLSKALKTLSDIDPVRLLSGTAAVLTLVSALTLSMKMLSSESSKVAKVGFALVTMGIAIKLLADAIALLSVVKPEGLVNGLLSVVALIGAMTGAMFLLSKLNMKNVWTLTAVGTVMVQLAAAIDVLVPAVILLGNMPFEKLALGVGALASVMTIFSVSLRILSTNALGVLGAAAAIAILSAAMDILIPAMLVLSYMPWKNLLQGLGSLAAILAMFSISLGLLSTKGNPAGMLAVSASMLILAAAIDILVPALILLGSVPFGVVVQGLGALAAVIAILGVSATVLSATVPAMIGLAGSLALIGASVFLVGAGISALGIGLGLIAANGVIAAVALKEMVMTLVLLLPEVATNLAEAVNNFVKTIVSNVGSTIKLIIAQIRTVLPNILTLIAQIVMSVCNSISTLAPTIFDTILGLLEDFLKTFESHLSPILDTIGQIFLDILQFLIDFAPQLAEKGVELIVSLINGMANAIHTHEDEIAEAVRNLVVSILTLIPKVILSLIGGVFEAAAEIFTGDKGFAGAIGDFIADIPKHMGEIIQSIVTGIGDRVHDLWEAGKNALQGFLNGFTDKDDKTGKAGKELGEAANKGAMKGLKEHSPSRTMYRIGEYAVMGLANGITDNQSRVMTAMENIGMGMNQIAQKYAYNLVKDSDTIINSNKNIKDYKKQLKSLQKAQKNFHGTSNYIGDSYESLSNNKVKLQQKLLEVQAKINRKPAGSVNKSSIATKSLKTKDGKKLTLTKRRITGVSGASRIDKIGDPTYYTDEEVKYYKDQVSKFNKQIADYKKKQKELAKSKKTDVEKFIEGIKLQNKIDSAIKKRDDAQSKLNTAKSKEKTTDYYINKEREAAYKKQIKEIKEVDAAMKAGNTKAMEKKYKSTAKTIDNLTLKNKAYQKQIDDVTKSRDKLDKQNKKWQEQQKKYAKDSNEYKFLQALIDANNKEIKNKEKTIKSLNSKISKNNTQIDKLSAENEARQDNINQIKEYQDAIKELTKQIEQEYADQALEALKAVQEEHDNIKNAIKDSLTSFDTLLSGTRSQIDLFGSSVTNTTKNMLKSMKKQITSVEEWEEKLHKLSLTGISDGLFDAIEKLGPGSKEIDTFLRMSSSQINEANALYKKTSDMTSQSMLDNMKKQRLALNEWNEKIQKLAKRGASKALLEEVVGAGVNSQEALDAMLNMTNSAFKEFNSLYSDADTFSDTMADSIQKAYIAAEAGANKFQNVGKNMVTGMIEGLLKNAGSLEKETRETALRTYEAACRVLGIHSPSRKFMEIGQYMMEGMAIGVKDNANNVIDENAEMMNTLMERTQWAANWLIGLSNRLSTDISPTITPTINTSGVYADASALNSLLNDSYAYNAALAVNSKLEFSRRYDELMNELINSVNGIGDDSQIVSELNAIAERIDILDSSITGMQVVMDSGALVGSIATGVDQQLGKEAKYAERGM